MRKAILRAASVRERPQETGVAVTWRVAYKFLSETVKPLDFSKELDRRMDPYWRKARIAARLLLKREAGKPWSTRDRRLALRLADDPGVTNRLLDQAVHSLQARKKYGFGTLGWFS
jgi:hypothetical protein